MKNKSDALCPCNSGKEYKNCCKLIHDGMKNAKSALELMTSRYAAYAMNRCDYIMQTTHRSNEQFMTNFAIWLKDIENFSYNTLFEGLKILDYQENGNEAYVTFHARLKQNGNDLSFAEQSRFVKEDEHWYYQEAEIFEEI